MQHYWGAKAILERIGLSPKTYQKFPAIRARHQIPCYHRRRGWKAMYYSNEAMISAWELSKARQDYEDLIAKQRDGIDMRFNEPVPLSTSATRKQPVYNQVDDDHNS